MSQTENDLFTLMAHAEDLQRVTKIHSDDVSRAAKHLEQNAAKTITAAIQAGIDQTLADTKKELQEATTGLVGASSEAKATAAYLRRTGVFQAVFLLGAGLVLAAGFYGFTVYLGGSKLDELNELRAAIRTEEATLADLQSKTWGLELVNYKDGTKGIILPKGAKVDRTGAIPDGREAIVIK